MICPPARTSWWILLTNILNGLRNTWPSSTSIWTWASWLYKVVRNDQLMDDHDEAPPKIDAHSSKQAFLSWTMPMCRRMRFPTRKSSMTRSCKKKGNLRKMTNDFVVPLPLDFNITPLSGFYVAIPYRVLCNLAFHTFCNPTFWGFIYVIFHTFGEFIIFRFA